MSKKLFPTIEQSIINIRLTDGNELMSSILSRLNEINSKGLHVLFDCSEIEVNPHLYLCTIFIDTAASPAVLRVQDQVTGKMYTGVYNANETIAQVFAKAVDAYVSITVNAVTQDGVTVTGQYVYLYEGTSSSGTFREKIMYNGSPVSFMVAKGFQYYVSIDSTLPQHFNPHITSGTQTGIANANTSVTFTYDDVASITTFEGLKLALAQFSDASSAKNVLVGKEMADTWIDYDVTGSGDATPAITGDGHPIWNDPWVITDVKAVEESDGTIHNIAAVLIRKYCGRYGIVYDAPNTEEVASGETADGTSYYYGLELGQTSPSAAKLTLIEKSAGVPLDAGTEIAAAGTYAKIYKNAYRDTSKNIVQYGHNRYGTSAIRQYLNADGTDVSWLKGAWWSQQHVGQTKPSSANSYSAYQRGCSAALLEYAKPVKHTVMSNTVSDGGANYTVVDKIFLPSCIEMYGTNNVDEGSRQREYWREMIGKTEVTSQTETTIQSGYYYYGLSSSQGLVYLELAVGAPIPYSTYEKVYKCLAPNDNSATINNVRKMFSVHAKSSAAYVWLRSASRGSSFNPWFVTSGGILYNSNIATYASAPAPACVIY